MIFTISMVSANVLTQTTSSINATTSVAGTTFAVVGTLLDEANVNINPTVTSGGTNNVLITANTNVDYANLKSGKLYSGSIFVRENATSNQTVSFSYLKTFCSNGSINDSSLSFEVDINNKGEGEDKEWLPLDLVEIEVDFENNKDVDIDDVVIQLALVDSSGKDVSDDLIWESSDEEEREVGDVDEGDDVSHTFEFKVSNDLEEGSYKLMVKVFPENEEEDMCIDYAASGLSGTYYETIDVERESEDDRQIIFEDVEVEPSNTIGCSQEVTVTAKAYNIGENDQEKVLINLYNEDLGVDIIEVLDDFDMEDSKSLEFSFVIPEDALEKKYVLNLLAMHDWDDDEEDDDLNAYDEESEILKMPIFVEGSCKGSIKDVEISASLSEETPKAMVGKEVIVKTTIENTGDTEQTYVVSVAGVSAWADAVISDESVTLGAGESKEIEIALDIDKDVEAGEQEFTIKTTFGSEVKEQKVLISVEEGGLFQGSIVDHLKDNAFIYTVVIVDLILIIAIVIAVRRMVAKRP